MEFTVLLDAPATATAKLQVAKLGDFESSRYGSFSITKKDVKQWGRNLASLPGGRALIDLDHGADRQPRKTEAAGWITDVKLEEGVPTATVEWTPVGQAAIAEKRYLFFSPTYGAHTDETGATRDNTLIGGALTNRPFLNMPAITLTDDETGRDIGGFVQAREVQQPPAERSSDSRRSMDTATIIKLLDLPADADDAAVEKAVKKLAKDAKQPKDPKPTGDVKTLEQQASDRGLKILDSKTYKQLVSDAAQGAQAAKDLRQQRFDHAFKTALDDGKALEAQRERYQHFYELDADGTIQALDEAPVILNTKPRGWKNGDGPNETAKTLDQLVNEKAKEKDISYADAYAMVLDDIDNGVSQLGGDD